MSIFNGLSEEVLKKVHLQEDKITGAKDSPRNHVVAEAKRELENIYSGDGRINPRYAKETIIAYGYSKSHFHHSTGNSMLEDIISKKNIDFYDYI